MRPRWLPRFLRANRLNASAAHTTCIIRAAVEPPSQVRNLTAANATSYSIKLFWLPPLSNGGRADVTYRVECVGAPGSISFSPGSQLTTESVIVYGLAPETRYVFRVYAENGVSGVAGIAASPITVEAATTATSGGGSGGGTSVLVGRLELEEASSDSLRIAWPLLADASMYEISYYPTKHPPHDAVTVQSSTNSVVVKDLSSSTAYYFKVNRQAAKTAICSFLFLFFTVDGYIVSNNSSSAAVKVTVVEIR